MIFTIGYSDRSLPNFIDELTRRGITQLVDVRSKPWSRNAAFNATQIERWSSQEGILYRRAGEILGGQSSVAIDDPSYLDALLSIIEASSREPVAVMCAEGDPAKCHRTWDIGASLLIRYGVVARSILRGGTEEVVTRTLRRVRPNQFRPSMLDAIGSAYLNPKVR